MTTSEIAAKYKINKQYFQSFIEYNGFVYKKQLHDWVVPDDKVEQYVQLFKKDLIRYNEEQKAISQILLTSGYNFEGYKIIKYSDYISGDGTVQIPRSGMFGGDNNSNLSDAIGKIRKQAIINLKEEAYALGCNAIIGLDFDYITIAPETANFVGGTLYEPYVICVTANGNAVIIEKTTED